MKKNKKLKDDGQKKNRELYQFIAKEINLIK
ncbi:hypothetical protein L1283_004911 [Sphingobacterium sp. HSC-15S19]